MVLVANGRLKRAMAHLVGEFSPVIQRHYKEVAATTGTAEAVRPWLPIVQPLGQGPARGDHSLLWQSWHMVQVVLAYCRERLPLKRQVHLFGFFDPALEQQPQFREMLTAALVRTGAYWFPTPATARAYLQALRLGQPESSPPLGTLHDPEQGFALALRHLTAGEPAAGVSLLEALSNQMVRTGDPQSRIWLLPAVQAILEQWPRSR